MADFVADTHALIWYLEDSPLLGAKARVAFSESERGEGVIFIPTICLVEIVYLLEKGRIPPDLKTKLDNEIQEGETGLIFADLNLEIANLVASVPRSEIPDLPDRIIAATALYLNLPVISRDKRISLSSIETIW